MKILKIHPEHMRDIWKWRNDILTLRMSANSHRVSWKLHKRWFNSKILSSKTFMYLGYHKKKKIGVVRFDIKNNIAFVAINTNPKIRGKKLSTPLLHSAIRFFYKKNNFILKSKIKKNNIPSIKCFLNCGFVHYKKYKNYFYFILKKQKFIS
jgi:RimJ/RimL family protein N-acetyltransferase